MPEMLSCATCNTTITDFGSALVEWLFADAGAYRFMIIHDLKTSPRGREGCSFHALGDSDAVLEYIPASQFLESALPTQISDLKGHKDTLVKLAISALENPEPTLRRRAALVLARLGDGAMPAVETLVQALGDSDEEVRFKAAFALKILGGIDYRDKADAVIRELAPVMGMVDALEPFVAESSLLKGIITEATDLTGEVGADVTGRVFLAPEEDYRGGGMGSVPLFGCRSKSGDLVKITGVYDHDIGIVVDSVVIISDTRH